MSSRQAQGERGLHDMTNLTARLVRLIAAMGPISVAHYMAECNAAYYAARDPLGVSGDFITAPEISQMFGEMVGVWLADIWTRAGRPEPVCFVELGAGRGTLARDALRVMARFDLRPDVHLVETSPVLRGAQRELLGDVVWHDDPSTLPDDAALLVVGNEFLDALPMRQMVKTDGGWRERMVGLDGARLVPVTGDRPMDAAVPDAMRDAPVGSIVESCPAAAAVVDGLARRIGEQGGAALLFDYGYVDAQMGSSLQAVKAHRKVDPFTAAGTADLTALVDFGVLADVCWRGGARHLGTAAQGQWLNAMGIGARAEALIAKAPEHAAAVGAALHRLTGADEMGSLFKVMGLAGAGWPNGAGFGL
jgi:NADH dehydrogenase [ubiquinone] 1 alpha subcomplex assembly factor 7